MTVEQTRGIVDHAREFHEQLAEYYHRMADVAQRPRVRLLLDYMSAHEQRRAAALAEYEDTAPTQILNTWLQSSADTDAMHRVRAELATLRIHPDLELDEVIEIGLRLTDCVLAVYRDLAERAEPASIRDVFQNLLQMEAKAQQQFARDSGRLRDI